MELKVCKKCNEEKELNLENFPQRKGKFGKLWHTYCRQCRRKTRIGEYSRNRPTEEKKMRMRGYKKMYNQTKKGTAILLLKAYRSTDKRNNREFNLVQSWFIENILNKECFYCGDNKHLGADRINNMGGHTVENVVPCCAVCNSVRSNIFTVEEMKTIGQAIRTIRQKRVVSKESGMKKFAKAAIKYRKPEIINLKVA